ncbi:hypothetical protein ASQ44_03810 [Rickettsia rhipicephali]|uniref:hypothetical protein n=1 Tax=Rickettsia rhipicephali TaxID=33992 RepID=UPI00070C2043|nr:hypothetical protein [Rickettsia rhipicephali]ALN41251.1 hypothetical protein ASQ44_03810 [Rickettsia rhipicephali]
MHLIHSFSSTPTYPSTDNFSNNNSTIFYHFVGNFVPPEWRNLSSANGKVLSKTARQLLSLIVFRLQIYHNNSLDELQETYNFFEQSLGLCQERVRQCLLELQKAGFIVLRKATIVKYGIKCRNVPCIKLARIFQPHSQKISTEDEKILDSTQKNFGANPKEFLPQPQKSLDHSIYIDNNKDISNKSRSTKSEIFQNEQNQVDANEIDNNQQLPQQKIEQNLQFEQKLSDESQVIDNTRAFTENPMRDALPLSATLQKVVQQVSQQRQPVVESNCSNISSIPVVNRKNSWFKRKRLADFYPLTQEDADLLQIKSNREFNLNFINKLLLKLAGEYSNHHFGHKKVLLNYMAKALSNELRETTKANSRNFQFKSTDENKTKEQYLQKIESSTDTSRQAQLKRKISSVFDTDTAYQLLTSCTFGKVLEEQFQVKLLKDISLSEHVKTKILQQVQIVYGNKITKLQIMPCKQSIPAIQGNNTKDENYVYLLELANQLNPDSLWYKARKFLIERYNKHVDITTFSKLIVVQEDNINKKVTLKPISAFYDYYIRDRHMQDLEIAFQAQNCSLELISWNDNHNVIS